MNWHRYALKNINALTGLHVGYFTAKKYIKYASILDKFRYAVNICYKLISMCSYHGFICIAFPCEKKCFDRNLRFSEDK